MYLSPLHCIHKFSNFLIILSKFTVYTPSAKLVQFLISLSMKIFYFFFDLSLHFTTIEWRDKCSRKELYIWVIYGEAHFYLSIFTNENLSVPDRQQRTHDLITVYNIKNSDFKQSNPFISLSHNIIFRLWKSTQN